MVLKVSAWTLSIWRIHVVNGYTRNSRSLGQGDVFRYRNKNNESKLLRGTLYEDLTEQHPNSFIYIATMDCL